MALPEELPPYYDSILLPEVLERALQTKSLAGHQRIDILNELARQLHFKEDSLDEDAYEVLWGLLRALEDNLDEEGAWSWIRDIESGRHLRIAEMVVDKQGVDVLIFAAREFGWQGKKIVASDFSDVVQGVRTAFAAQLGDRIRQLLQDWVNKNVWNHTMESRRERIARLRSEDQKRSS